MERLRCHPSAKNLISLKPTLESSAEVLGRWIYRSIGRIFWITETITTEIMEGLEMETEMMT